MTPKLTTDLSRLCDVRAPEHPAYPAFSRRMQERCYVGEALDDAWIWFSLGWDSHGGSRSGGVQH